MARIYRDYYKMYSISPDATDIEVEEILKTLLKKYQVQERENAQMQREYSCIYEAYQALTKDRKLYDLEYKRRNPIVYSYPQKQDEEIEKFSKLENMSFGEKNAKKEEFFIKIAALENRISSLHEQVGIYSNEWMHLMDLKREIPKKVAQCKEKIQSEKSYCDAILFLKEMEEREKNPLKKLFIGQADFEKKRVCLELITMYTLKIEDYKKELEEEARRKEEELHKKEGQGNGQIEPFDLEEKEMFSFASSKQEEVGKVIV